MTDTFEIDYKDGDVFEVTYTEGDTYNINLGSVSGTYIHKNLTGNNWADAGHTIDTDIDMADNSLVDLKSVKLKDGGVVQWNGDFYTTEIVTGLGPVLQVGQEQWVLIYNDTASTIDNFTVLRPAGAFPVNGINIPTVEKAKSDTFETAQGTIFLATMDIPAGEIGFAVRFGRARGGDTSMWSNGDDLFISPTTAGALTNVRPEFPNYNISVGGVINSDVDGEIFVSVTRSIEDTTTNFWNGTIRESFNFVVSSDGAIITGSLSPANGHPNLTMIFSDGLTTLITTPDATIPLIAGTDEIPQENFVYITKANKILEVSTSSFPIEEHIRISRVVLSSAGDVQIHDALKVRNYNDEICDTNTYQGHLTHITDWIRSQPAKWLTGCEGTISGTPNDVYFSTTSGTIKQLHTQVVDPLSMPTDDIHVINNFATPYIRTNNLNTEVLDSKGNSISNSSFSFVFWAIGNSTGTDDHIMCNLPSGSYLKNNPENAVEDAFNYSNYSIPSIYNGVGFLIGRATFVLEADGLTWSLYDYENLRGTTANTSAGGGSSGSGVTSFLGLTDTPSSYIGQSGKTPVVNGAETALEFKTSGSSLPIGYINGGVIQYLDDDSVSVSSGFCRSEDNTTDITILANADVTAVLSANTTYFVNVDSAGVSTISISIGTGTNRRIGSFITDSIADIIPFSAYGEAGGKVRYIRDTIEDISSVKATVLTYYPISVPIGIPVRPIISATHFNQNASSKKAFVAGTDGAEILTNRTSSGSNFGLSVFESIVVSDGELGIRLESGTGDFQTINIGGFIDERV